MNAWYQMCGKTYQCQISNAGGSFISVIRYSKLHDFSMTFDDLSKFHDFPWLFHKILFFQVFQVFENLWEPCFGYQIFFAYQMISFIMANYFIFPGFPGFWEPVGTLFGYQIFFAYQMISFIMANYISKLHHAERLLLIGHTGINSTVYKILERLHFEIPPAAPWLPILVIHIRS